MESSLPEALAPFHTWPSSNKGGSEQMRDRAGAGENKPVSWRGSDGDITVGGSRVKETEESEEETERFLCLWWKCLGERQTPQQQSGLLFDPISFFSFPLVSGA